MLKHFWTTRKLKSGRPATRRAAVEALATSTARNANALLIKALSDKAEMVREAAAHALAERGAVEAIPAIVTRLRREYQLTQKSFAEALDRLGWQPASPAEQALFAVALEDWERAAEAGEAAAALLLDRLKFYRTFVETETASDPRYVPDYARMLRGVAEALGRIGDLSAVRPLLALYDAPSLEEAGVPAAVREAYAAMGPPALTVLRDLVNGANDRLLRRTGLAALIGLGWQPDPSLDADLLIRLLDDAESLRARNMADSQDEAAGRFLLDALHRLLSDHAAQLSESELETLASFGGAEAPAGILRLQQMAQAALQQRGSQ